MVATAHIITEHRSFNCICQVATICIPSNTWFFGPTRVNTPTPSNGISMSSAIFEGLTVITSKQTHKRDSQTHSQPDRQTDRQTSHMARCVTFAVARIRIAYFPSGTESMGDKGSKKAYTGPRTGIYLPTKYGCDR